MCKCCQNCLETLYWHLIEKRFCYDESIALYEDPNAEKEEKNNNSFDNMAFYDSIAVIAGRAVVTIDQPSVISRQPSRRKSPEFSRIDSFYRAKSTPALSLTEEEPIMIKTSNIINTESTTSADETDKVTEDGGTTKSDTPSTSPKQNSGLLLIPEKLEARRKSLLERRMSKSLYLKIEHPKELPMVRQQSMPKFYLDTPGGQEMLGPGTYRPSPSAALASPIPTSTFKYDLYSVVQMERARRLQSEGYYPQTQGDKNRRLAYIKEKIKMRRAKSFLGQQATQPTSY